MACNTEFRHVCLKDLENYVKRDLYFSDFSDEEIEVIDQRVKDLVSECERFAEDSPYPELNVMYDVVYDQENYPFIPHKL